MDPRVRDHAALLVDHCTDVQQGEDVLIWAPAAAEDLVVALHEECGKRGANPAILWDCDRATRAYLRAADPADFETPQHTLRQMEETDVSIVIGAERNTFETSDVDPEVRSARSAAQQPHMEAYLDTRWVGTHHPAPGHAQQAELSTEAYADFCYDAMLKDWSEQAAFNDAVVDLLDPANEVRVVAGEHTDLTMRVDGNRAVSDVGEKNMPGGEVFTVPHPDSVEGEVLFDVPLTTRGREVVDVHLVFEDGEIVEYSAGKNEDALAALLDTDDGASRLGELGFGTNRDIDRFTGNPAFDEKVGDTVHMALGRTIEEAVGEGNPANDSAIHEDLVVDVSEDAFVEVDGEVIQRNGTFAFEDGFEE